MKKILASAICAITVFSLFSFPASAMTVEKVGEDCRINLTLEDAKETRIYDPIYLSPKEVDELIDLYNKRTDNSNQSEEYKRGDRKIRNALQECKQQQASSSTSKSSTGAVAGISGLLGAVIGAVLAVLAVVPLMQNFLKI
ncbi:hypothetical protein CMUST_05995 [Corynebacterium mustelae]|uniref:Secreted protein n=1 Tax=Corynebacterium mustelae TaxID=571915 RepID=A0A0G3GYA2_9CORY|nr:hypothetical protein [Corynebacterium mustelae]AKK05535.1 hypothetical protein CMUST_05995 [Corynebacterium mustelae]